MTAAHGRLRDPWRRWLGHCSLRYLVFASVILLILVNQQRFNNQVAHQSVSRGDEQVQRLDGLFRIHTDWHPQNRSDRFPSVEERVKLYMSNWYPPPCRGPFQYQRESVQSRPVLYVLGSKNRTFDSIVKPDEWFLLDPRVMKNCARQQWQHVLWRGTSSSRVEKRRNMRPYCQDVMDLLDITSQLDGPDTTPTPLLAYFGDGPGLGLPLPFFAKYRAAAAKERLTSAVTADDCDTRSTLLTAQHADMPIIWKLESSRHFLPLERARKMDTPWEHKKDRAFWAGDMTGPYSGDTDLQRCRSNQRCRFVLDHARSNLIDCGLTHHQLGSDVVNGTNIKMESVSMAYIQQHKVIVSLEGNDVASGLKWSLQSESVVVMPQPTLTSWAMEEVLEPWVHYVPMFANGSNAEEMVTWVLDHPHEARRIAERATLFIYDLLYHPDAPRDERLVKEEIVRRYRAFWN